MASGPELVKEFLKSRKMEVEVLEFGESTRSTTLAAAAIGCSPGEIAKSVVFVGGETVVVVLSGDRRVDLRRLAGSLGGEPLRQATSEEVLQRTGYVAGGVPPFPHRPGVRILLDSSLWGFERVWAAGGSPNTVFQIRVGDLWEVVGGERADVSY